MKPILLLLLSLVTSIAYGQSKFTVQQDCLRIQDGICVDKNELGYIDGATSNVQTQITSATGRITTLEANPVIKEYTNFAGFPATGDSTSIYLDKAQNKTYRWNGSVYVLVGDGVGTGDVVGPSSATDNALARFDTTTGKLIQNSTAILSDGGDLTSTTVKGGDVLLSGDTVSTATTNANLTIDANGTGQAINEDIVRFKKHTFSDILTQNTSGSFNDIILQSYPTYRFTNSALVSISGFTDLGTVKDGQDLTIINATGVTFKVLNESTSSTATSRISAPGGKDISVLNNQSVKFLYDGTTARWRAVGGSGASGASAGRLELMDDPSFEDSFADGTCSGCTASLTTSNRLVAPNNEKQLRLTFAASAGSYTVAKTTGSIYAGVDMTVWAWVTTTQSGCLFKSMVNGTETGATKTIVNDGIPHYYELTPVGGATSNGYKVDCISSITGTVDIDETTVRADKRQAILAYVANSSDQIAFTPTGSWATNSTYSGLWSLDSGWMTIQYKLVLTGAPNATNLQFNMPTGYVIDPAKLAHPTSVQSEIPQSNGNFYDLSATQDSSLRVLYLSNSSFYITYPTNVTDALAPVTQAVPATASTGDIYTVNVRVPVIGVRATNANFLSAPETFSTDYTPLTWVSTATYNLTTLANAPIGTIISYQYTGGTYTQVGCTSAPTQTTSDMTANGIFISTRAYASTSSCTAPSIFAMQIGKDLPGYSGKLYKNTSSPRIAGSMDSVVASSLVQFGLAHFDYSEKTGILYIDAGRNALTTITTWNFNFDDISAATSGYLTVKASKFPSMAGLNAQGIAYCNGSATCDIQSVYFGSGANCSSICTTGNCTICNQVGTKISTISWIALGGYLVNGIDGTKYNCTGTGYDVTTPRSVPVTHDRVSSTTTYARITMGGPSANVNTGYNSIVCFGIP